MPQVVSELVDGEVLSTMIVGPCPFPDLYNSIVHSQHVHIFGCFGSFVLVLGVRSN